jgi:hypothetical protein
MPCIRAVLMKMSSIFMVGMTAWGCGSPPPPAVSPANQPAAAAPELSHAVSCERVDALFQFESRRGEGAVSPMYGFPAVDQAEPTDEEVVRYLTEVLSSVRKMSPRFAPSVREKSTLIVDKLEAQRAVREKRIAEEKKKSEESSKRVEAAKNDPVKMRQEALRDAAEYGMMGMLGNESEMGPLREEYFDAYLAFFDECATDLGISEKAQAAHHAIFPRKSEREDKK